MSDHAAYLRTEILIGVVINAVLSIVFFAIVFGLRAPVAVGGVTGYAADFLPQSFMIGLMGTLVPGAITKARLGRGVIVPADHTSRLPVSIALRSVLLALLGMLIGAVVGGVLALVAGGALFQVLPAVLAKCLYGGLLGGVITRIGLHAALARQTASPGSR